MQGSADSLLASINEYRQGKFTREIQPLQVRHGKIKQQSLRLHQGNEKAKLATAIERGLTAYKNSYTLGTFSIFTSRKSTDLKATKAAISTLLKRESGGWWRLWAWYHESAILDYLEQNTVLLAPLCRTHHNPERAALEVIIRYNLDKTRPDQIITTATDIWNIINKNEYQYRNPTLHEYLRKELAPKLIETRRYYGQESHVEITPIALNNETYNLQTEAQAIEKAVETCNKIIDTEIRLMLGQHLQTRLNAKKRTTAIIAYRDSERAWEEAKKAYMEATKDPDRNSYNDEKKAKAELNMVITTTALQETTTLKVRAFDNLSHEEKQIIKREDTHTQGQDISTTTLTEANSETRTELESKAKEIIDRNIENLKEKILPLINNATDGLSTIQALVSKENTSFAGAESLDTKVATTGASTVAVAAPAPSAPPSAVPPTTIARATSEGTPVSALSFGLEQLATPPTHEQPPTASEDPDNFCARLAAVAIPNTDPSTALRTTQQNPVAPESDPMPMLV